MKEEKTEEKKKELLAYNTKSIGIEAVRATEAAAIAASKWLGSMQNNQADAAAVSALRLSLDRISMNGRIVIGEGERDKAPMLYEGEKVGSGIGPNIDIAVDPLEGTNLCSKNLPNAISVIAFAKKGDLLHAPDLYMEKIAVCPSASQGLLDGSIHLDNSISSNINQLAKITKKDVSDLTICILERERHEEIIRKVSEAGARVRLIPDGDILGILSTTVPQLKVDMYIGIGGAPEGVLSAAAIQCFDGEMQARLVISSEADKKRTSECGIPKESYSKIYSTLDLASGDVIFAATGVSDGEMLKGVNYLSEQSYYTHSVLMRAQTKTIRFFETYHNLKNKTWLKFHSKI